MVGSHPPSSPEPAPPRRGRSASVAFLTGLVLLAFLVASAARQSRPGPRLSPKARLVDLIREQDDRTAALRKELETLKARLAELEAGVEDRTGRVKEIRDLAAELEPYAGLAPIQGPGLRVELRDSTLRESPTGDPNDLVIHEQDIQAVVNAMWTGGAEGIAVNGERVTGLSAIRCVGNTLLLHGSVYSPPFRIVAVGDAAKMLAAFDADESIERLRILAEKFKLGFKSERAAKVSLPGFRGIAGMRFVKT